MKVILNSFLMAFSMYSTVPVKFKNFDEKNMRYAMAFFPFIGIFECILIYIWFLLWEMTKTNSLIFAAVLILIDFLVTGGIHLDGFSDTSDAIFSRRDKETRIKILKDPHCGAFAVISLCICLILKTAAAMEVNKKIIILFISCLVLSRILSAVSVIFCKISSHSYLAKSFNKDAAKGTGAALIIECIIFSVLLLYFFGLPALILLGLALILFFICRVLENKLFGGLSGDTAGFFQVSMETLWMLACVLLKGVFL